jgi:hypothetical protein
MTVATLVCETLDLVPKRVDEEMERHEALVAAALKARKVAEKVVEKRRDELAEAIVEAFRTGKFKAAQLAKIAEYTPEHVRRILRAHGIEGDPTRLTPTQRDPTTRRSRRTTTDPDAITPHRPQRRRASPARCPPHPGSASSTAASPPPAAPPPDTRRRPAPAGCRRPPRTQRG